jgi:hypothetical protein
MTHSTPTPTTTTITITGPTGSHESLLAARSTQHPGHQQPHTPPQRQLSGPTRERSQAGHACINPLAKHHASPAPSPTPCTRPAHRRDTTATPPPQSMLNSKGAGGSGSGAAAAGGAAAAAGAAPAAAAAAGCCCAAPATVETTYSASSPGWLSRSTRMPMGCALFTGCHLQGSSSATASAASLSRGTHNAVAAGHIACRAECPDIPPPPHTHTHAASGCHQQRLQPSTGTGRL